MDEIQDLVAKGQSFLEDGKFDEALDFFERALILNQDDPDPVSYTHLTLPTICSV